MSAPPVTPRPSRTDKIITKQVAEKLLPDFARWMKTDDAEVDQDDLLSDLIKALGYDDDGYEIARNLDHNGYSPDAELVGILDAAGDYRRNIHSEARKAWVAATNLQPVPIDTKVRWPGKPTAGVGVVTKNHLDGKSTVSFPNLGHARGSGYVVEWEELKIVTDTP